MTRRTLLIVLLAGAHLAVLAAGFVAPYDPAEQVRSSPFAPPSTLHVVDADGRFHLRPFVNAPSGRHYPSDATSDQPSSSPLRLFVHGSPYTVVPGVRSDLHLFGVDPPGRLSLLGTDAYGRDVFSRLLHGTRMSLAAGLLATWCALLAAILIGTVAGYYGGIVDTILMRAADVFMAVPWIYLLFALRAALPLRLDTRATLLLLIVVLGAAGWARPARLIRGIVLSARERAYVLAARGFGGGAVYLLRRHIAPSAWGVVLTQAAMLVPQYVVAEVTLSFLGLGVGEPAPSLGNMLAALQQYHVLASYWWMFAPAGALVAVALAYHAIASLVHARVRAVAS